MTAHQHHAARPPRRLRPCFTLRPLALALAGASLLSLPGLSPGQVPPLPTGLNVVQGQAKAVVTGNQLTVTNSANSILNWQTFSIGQQHGVTFVQPNVQSQVLNRVTGNDPSSILGSLSSNGRVWLINPNGVIFGQGARIDVAGIVTSTLNLNDLDWLGGRYAFSSTGNAAGIVNQGELRTSLGGQIALIGGSVRNEGVIEARGGQVLIAAGRSVELVDTGAPNLRLKITAPQGEALNLGSVTGGRIDVHAAVINQQGIVRADSLGTNAAGDIVLGATQQLNLATGSVTSASGGQGGRLTLDSGADGTTLVQGRVEATGHTGPGGNVQVLGRQVGLIDGAQVDVSGRTGGGQALVGGGERGQDPTVRNAQAVYVAGGAALSADAGSQGDGGRIVLWGNEATRAYGSFSARGGSAGGNGGFIETSGGFLDVVPAKLDAAAPLGRAGTWLLDPYNILISDVVSANTGVTQTSGPVTFTGSSSPSQIDPRTIVSALNSGNSVVVSTGTGGSEPGDITVQRASINVAPNVPVSLTLQAARRIDVSSSTIASDGAALSVNLQAAGSGSGSASVVSSLIRSAGGNITVNGVGYNDVQSGSGYGVRLVNATLTAGAGTVTLSGNRVATAGTELAGVSLTSATLSGRDIGITGNASSQASSTANGVEVFSSNLLSTHSLNISGSSTGTGVSIDSAFSTLSVTPPAADPSASMSIFGSSSWSDFSAAGYRNYGVDIVGQYGGGLELTNGATLAIAGTNVAGGLPSLSLRGGVIIGGPSAGNATLSGNNTASLGTSMGIGGRIRVTADEVIIPGGSSLRSDATGDALVAVSGSTLTSRFDNQAGGAAFNTPNGRWLVFGRDTTRVLTGGLAAAFKQYGATSGSTGPLTPATGNGLLYTDTPVIVFSGSAFTKAYDGNTTAGPLNPTAVSTSGLRDADVLSFVGGATGSFADPNAGTNKPVSVAATSFTVADANGIPVLGYGRSSSLLGTIARRSLTSGITVANKVYDGNTTASVTLGTLSGLVGSETLGSSATGNFNTPGVGTAKPVTVTVTLANGTGLASNYQYVANPSLTPRADITPRPLTLRANDASKTFGTTLNFAGTEFTATGLVPGETVGSVTLASTGAPASASVAGSPYAITASNATGGSFAASNYGITYVNGTLTVTPAALNAVLASIVGNPSKAYDGTDVASLGQTNYSLTGFVGSDGAVVTQTAGRYDSANAGPRTVTATLASSDFTPTGSTDLRNYTLPTSASGTGTITPRIVSVTGLVANNKVYDGSTVATLANNGSLSGLVGTQTLTLSNTGAAFADQNAGTGKTVTVTGLSLGNGSGLASNYQLASTTGTTNADITPRLLTAVSLSAANKVYDANTAASVTLAGLNGLVGSETLLSSSTGSFDTKDAGTGKTVTVGTTLADGSNGGLAANYRIQPATTTADITPRTLTLGPVSAADKVYDGNTAAVVTLGALGNLVGGETLVASATGRFDTPGVGNNKPVNVDVVLANGSNGGRAGNYQLPTGGAVLARAAVTPATLVYTADPASKVVGAPVPPLSGRVGGFVAGESLATATTGTLAFTTPAVAASPAGRYAINGGGLAASNYRFVQADANATALEVSGFQPTTQTEDNSRAPLARVLEAVRLPPGFSTPAEGRVLDVLQALRGRALGEGALFDPIQVGELSVDELTSLLAARDRYKKTLFAESIRRLEQDPTLADLPPCPSMKEVDNGTCLITEDLKQQLRAERGGVQVAASPAPTPAAPAAPRPPAAPAAPGPAASSPTAPGAVTAPPTPPVVAAAPAAPAALVRRRVRSASLPQIERKVAVVIGVDRYTDRSIPQLDNAVRDAKAIGNLLENTLGYETVVLQNAGKQDVVRALNRLAVDLGPNDSVVVYYAGHGELVEATKLGYWQLADSDAKRPETWLSNADITRLVGRIGASQVALISDSCYSGSLVDERLRPTGGSVDPGQLLTRKTVVVMSSGGNEPVFDSGKRGHSPFAYSLMNNLERVANWQVGGNVFERVRFAVARELPQRPRYGTAAAAGHQAGGDYLFEQRQLDSPQ